MKFGKWYVDVFDGKYKKYGGHWGWLRETGLDYLIFGFDTWDVGYIHTYYDGNHHKIGLGFLFINWGTPP